MTAKMAWSCTVRRRSWVTTSNFSGDILKEEWVERACDTPLFSDEEREHATCKSCRKAWQVDLNYIIEHWEEP